jgi:hypothetical protein
MSASGLHVLFAQGKRPSRAAIRRFAGDHPSIDISHDPDEAVAAPSAASCDECRPASSRESGAWLELLRDGLTFDVTGLAPGPSCAAPDIAYRFDIEDRGSEGALEAIRIAPGTHLSGGERTLPVFKGMAGLVRDLVHHFDDVRAICWPPARSAIGRRYYESVVTAWLEGGAFPALGFCAFDETAEGALQSSGLEHWTGQELRIEPPISADKVAATRLGVRLINQLVLVGGIEESERFVAPDGARLVMRPSRNRRFVQVWRE